MATPVRDAVVRLASKERNRLRIGLLSTIRGAAPVDTGRLRRNIRAGRGDVLVTINGAEVPYWYYNEIGVPHPGNRANRGWLSNAVDRFVSRNARAVGTTGP